MSSSRSSPLFVPVAFQHLVLTPVAARFAPSVYGKDVSASMTERQVRAEARPSQLRGLGVPYSAYELGN